MKIKNILNKFIILSSMLLLSMSGQVFAIELKDAKSAGLVGEKSSGYLGAPSKPSTKEAIALIKQVNNKRRNKYKLIAEKNGLDLKQVEQQAAKILIKKTRVGHYVYTKGTWLKK